jgi:ubiquinone/menaquinone biosynthesis C-methylase UbiE
MRFETPEQEIEKLRRRLSQLGAETWPKNSKIVEPFCGRGNGLHALERLGFTCIEGADLSASLLNQYSGPANRYLCDCRRLPFDANSKDVVIIQGGLHHLPTLPDDLDQTLSEVRRVLKSEGRLVVVEPWRTPFLMVVHFLCNARLARSFWPKLDSFSAMRHYERRTYDQWLGQSVVILNLFRKHFMLDKCSRRLGKLMLIGRPKR